MARWLIEADPERGHFLIQFHNAAFQFAAIKRATSDSCSAPPMSRVLRVFNGAERFELSR